MLSILCILFPHPIPPTNLWYFMSVCIYIYIYIYMGSVNNYKMGPKMYDDLPASNQVAVSSMGALIV
jgi:hypothetical protein